MRRARFEAASTLARRLILVLATTVAGAAWLVHKGPVPVIRITTEIDEFAAFRYMLTAFPVLGMLLADLADGWRRREPGARRGTIVLAVNIACAVALSSLRLGIRLPVSGHALVVAYFLARRWCLPGDRGGGRLEVGCAAAILAAIAYAKLVWWTDPITLGAGIGLALLLALVERALTGAGRPVPFT